jgi:asparagine synthase (glutamine-hydrolysing)
MPSRFKARDGQTKYLFKQVVQELLPAEIIHRKKTPLPIPRDPKTLGGQVRRARELLGAAESRSADCFDLDRVNAFLDQRDEFQQVDALAVWQVSMYLITMELLFREFRL